MHYTVTPFENRNSIRHSVNFIEKTRAIMCTWCTQLTHYRFIRQAIVRTVLTSNVKNVTEVTQGTKKKIAENWNHLTLNEPVYLFHLKNSLFLYQTSSNRQQYFAGILLLHHKISLLFELWCNPLLIVDLLQLNHVERSSAHAHAHISAFISFSIRVFFRVSISCVDLFKVYCSMTTWTRQKNERLLQSKHGVYCLF